MQQSRLFPRTKRQAPRDEVSTNAKLLIRGGFVQKLGSGIYNFLPLGWRVHKKIEQIIREEMDAIGGQELNLAALHPKVVWEATERWETFNALYKLISHQKDEYALGATHEEVLTPIVAQFVASYRDLPIYLYQIQVKFRDEPRAKSGLLRGREFIMKDLYSFHASEQDRASYYEKVAGAYKKIFKRMGLETIYTEASGGAFSPTSHEFQVPTPAGEDEIIYCQRGHFSQNIEIAKQKEGDACPVCGEKLLKAKTIEVGNIFPLGTRFSEAASAYFMDKGGKKKPIVMGSYGIGLGRVMGALVEVYHDKKGIIWPKNVAPYSVHLISIEKDADDVYGKLQKAGVEVLYDDRDMSAGEKFADADLIGIPVRLVVSKETADKVEWKKRDSEKSEIISFEEVINRLEK